MRNRRIPLILPAALFALLPLASPADSRKALAIQVNPEGFNASKADIHAVCRSAADQLLRHMKGLEKTTTLVSRGDHGPIVLFRRGEKGEHLIRLTTGKLYWAQYAYQFSHESSYCMPCEQSTLSLLLRPPPSPSPASAATG